MPERKSESFISQIHQSLEHDRSMANAYFDAIDELIEKDIAYMGSVDSGSDGTVSNEAFALGSSPLPTDGLERWRPPDIPAAIYNIYAESFYKVFITPRAKKKYIQKFERKYKHNWDLSFTNLCKTIERIEAHLSGGRVRVVQAVDNHRLVKIYFPIVGSKTSAKDSGYRCIAYLSTRTREAQILLIYSKNEIDTPREMVKVKSIIKKDYKQLAKLFG